MNTDQTNSDRIVPYITTTPVPKPPPLSSALPARTGEDRSLAVLPKPRINMLPGGRQKLVDAIQTLRGRWANLGFGPRPMAVSGVNPLNSAVPDDR